MEVLQRRLMRFASVALVVIGWGAILVAPSGASAAIINSTVHGTVQDGIPQDGNPNSLVSTSVLVRNVLSPDFQQRGIIEFNISGLTDTVALAELSLSGDPSIFINPFISQHTINVLGYSGNGSLEFSDYSAGLFLTSFNYFDQANVTVDVTTFINAQIGNTWAGFVLLAPGATDVDELAVFGLAGGGDFSAVPFPDLVVTAVPLPAALPLFLSALAGLGFFGWRRRMKAGA